VQKPVPKDQKAQLQHDIPVMPESVVGSPVDLAPQPLDALAPEFMTMLDGTMPWWRPGVLDISKTIGWRWLLLLPILLTLAAVVMSFVFAPAQAMQFLGTELKIAALAAGGGIAIVLWAVRTGVSARTDIFCIHCGYTLGGLSKRGTCPECGRPYTFDVIAEFKKDPHFFAERFRALRSCPRYASFEAGTGPTPWDGAS